jgi:hypothetical protein
VTASRLGVGVGVALAEPVGVGWVAGFSSTGAHALNPSARTAAVTTARGESADHPFSVGCHP